MLIDIVSRRCGQLRTSRNGKARIVECCKYETERAALSRPLYECEPESLRYQMSICTEIRLWYSGTAKRVRGGSYSSAVLKRPIRCPSATPGQCSPRLTSTYFVSNIMFSRHLCNISMPYTFEESFSLSNPCLPYKAIQAVPILSEDKCSSVQSKKLSARQEHVLIK